MNLINARSAAEIFSRTKSNQMFYVCREEVCKQNPPNSNCCILQTVSITNHGPPYHHPTSHFHPAPPATAMVARTAPIVRIWPKTSKYSPSMIPLAFQLPRSRAQAFLRSRGVLDAFAASAAWKAKYGAAQSPAVGKIVARNAAAPGRKPVGPLQVCCICFFFFFLFFFFRG